MDPRTFMMQNPSGIGTGNRAHTTASQPAPATGPSVPQGLPSRRMVAEPGRPRLGSLEPALRGPLGITPDHTPRYSPTRTGRTRREREQRASSRERDRRRRGFEQEEAQEDLDARIQTWITRMMSVEKTSRDLAFDMAKLRQTSSETIDAANTQQQRLDELRETCHDVYVQSSTQFADLHQRLYTGTKDLTNRFEGLDAIMFELDNRVSRIEHQFFLHGQSFRIETEPGRFTEPKPDTRVRVGCIWASVALEVPNG